MGLEELVTIEDIKCYFSRKIESRIFQDTTGKFLLHNLFSLNKPLLFCDIIQSMCCQIAAIVFKHSRI